jgi:hypothetical protein
VGGLGEGEEPRLLTEIPIYPMDVLPTPMRRLVESAGLPPALVGGAALAALAAAIGPRASIEPLAGWHQRAIVWAALLAATGAGKSPSQSLALSPLRDHDAELHVSYRAELDQWLQAPKQSRGPRPRNPTLLGDDTTLEAMARRLDGRDGMMIDADELTALLRGLGQYKSGGSDRGRFLALWTGGPWIYGRVGADAVGTEILIAKPTLVVCGGLQPALHELLGSEDDGLRPRWLPHLAAMPDEPPEDVQPNGTTWRHLLIVELVAARDRARVWSLSGSALEAFRTVQRRWKEQARRGESASLTGALVKADVQLARVVLALAEAEHPARGGEIYRDLVDRAVALVDFSLDCWRALPEQGGMALSMRDERLDRHVDRLVAWLEQHGGKATRRELLRAGAGGVQTADDLDQILQRYVARYPRTISHEEPAHGGRVATVVQAPRRLPSACRIVSTDNVRAKANSPAQPSSQFTGDLEELSETAKLGTDNAGTDNVGTDNDGSTPAPEPSRWEYEL